MRAACLYVGGNSFKISVLTVIFMAVNYKKYKLELNSLDKLEELLQEMYDEACANIETVQANMNKFLSSTDLNDETSDGKAKIGKVINDFIANKDRAIGRKIEVAKLMNEVLKNGKNSAKANDENGVCEWGKMLEGIDNDSITKYQFKG